MTVYAVPPRAGEDTRPPLRPPPFKPIRTATMPPKEPLEPGADHDLAHFATRLRQWREDQGMVLKQAASRFGVAVATWSRWEKQERFPSPANLRLLAEFIGVPICCFFYPAPGSCPHCPGNRQDNPPDGADGGKP